MSQILWQAAPLMTESFFSANGVFEEYDDIYKSEIETGANESTWLKFTLLWTWPGPVTKLEGGPEEIHARIGIRRIPFDSIKVDFKEAFTTAMKHLHSSNCGDKFVGSIVLYWPLIPDCPEPFYSFHTNTGNVVHVGAYTGKLSGCGL